MVIRGGAGDAALVQAAEAIGPSELILLKEQSGREPTLVLTAQRALALGYSEQPTGPVVLRPRGEFDATALRTLVDPLATAGAPPDLLSTFEVAHNASLRQRRPEARQTGGSAAGGAGRPAGRCAR